MNLKEQFRKFWINSGMIGRDPIFEKIKNGNEEWMTDITYTNVREWIKEFKKDIIGEPDKEIIEENIKLARQKQKFQDTNRIERKSFREHTRIVNAIQEYNKELINELKNHSLKDFTVSHYTNREENKIGIVHISDIHFNNLINLKSNKFDFSIAAKRLQYLAYKAKKYFKNQGIQKIVVCSTGDLLNKDDILDKQLNNATNRAKATVLACHIMSQFLLDLNQEFMVEFFGVCGNESRCRDEIGYSEIVSSDSYDYTLNAMLYHRFLGQDKIKINLTNDSMEQVINILNQNILLLHGHQLQGKDPIDSLSKILMKYLHDGIKIDYVLSGHIHMAYVSDLFSRCSSLCGTDSYANYALHLNGRASQNLIIVDNLKNRDGIKVDLQNYPNDLKGYDIIEDLAVYDIRNIDKMRKNKTIFKIVI